MSEHHRPDRLVDEPEVRSRRALGGLDTLDGVSMPDPEAAELYGLDLDRFVPARRELAQRLRTAGERDRASAVGRLPKPTLGAWAVNLAARRRPEARDALLDAGEALRDAQERLLAGEDPERLRDASAAERRARADLLEVVDEVLEDAGRGSPDVRRRAGETLAAAATDPEVAEELREARLTRDHVPISLGGMTLGAGPAPPGRAPAPSARPKAARAEAARPRPAPTRPERRPVLEAARAEAETAEKELRAATAARERAEEAARAAAEARAAARGELARAEAALRDGLARLQAERREAAERDRAALATERASGRALAEARAAEARAATRQRAAAAQAGADAADPA
jgi:hypothetical protein